MDDFSVVCKEFVEEDRIGAGQLRAQRAALESQRSVTGACRGRLLRPSRTCHTAHGPRVAVLRVLRLAAGRELRYS